MSTLCVPAQVPPVAEDCEQLRKAFSEIVEPSPKIQKTHDNGVSTNGASEVSPFLRVKKLSENAILPARASLLSAGYDLSSAVETKVPARGKALVPTDLSIAVPERTYARIAPRSGLAWKHSIDVGAGVVDADYRGPVGVILFNHSDVDFEVKPGDRIAQLIIQKIVTPEVTEVDDLDSTSRGSGGFGSTGVILSNTMKPCSGYKMKEMTGSGIFKAKGENGTAETEDTDQTPANKSGLRMYQQTLVGGSHISFGDDGSVSPKKPTTQPEVTKQRELSGNLESDSDAKLKKHISDAKNKELSGNNIFAPPPEIQPRPLATKALALRESITIGEPTSNNGMTFSKETPPASAEKPLSSAKLRDMSGSNIFSDGKVESRDYFGGVRKPPGGESSIALV